MLSVLIPAAGASRRMGGQDKLLMPVGEHPCLRVMALRALKAADNVIVTLPAPDHPRVAALEGLDVTEVTVPDWAQGMSASLKAGIAALPDTATAVMILPADMPGITASDLALLWAAFQTLRPPILRGAGADGTPGHPVIFDKTLFPSFRDLSGDTGAASIIAQHQREVVLLPLKEDRAVRDLDTPEDWARWQAEQGAAQT